MPRQVLRSDTVGPVRIVGVRISAPFARVLVENLEREGFDGTAGKIAKAIELQVTTEAPLTTADHDAVLAALEGHCPAGLYRLRRELEKEQRLRGGLTGLG